jgi:hypothetical protein
MFWIMLIVVIICALFSHVSAVYAGLSIRQVLALEHQRRQAITGEHKEFFSGEVDKETFCIACYVILSTVFGIASIVLSAIFLH